MNIMRKISGKIALLLAVAVLFTSAIPVNAQTPYTEEEMQVILETYAQILVDSVTYDIETKEYTFHADAAEYFGLTSEEISLLETIFNSMSEAEKVEFFGTTSPTTSVFIGPLAAFLAGMVATWVLDKLFAYGVKKFCNAYRNYNSWTKKGCEIFG
jgi:hypothetical protein